MVRLRDTRTAKKSDKKLIVAVDSDGNRHTVTEEEAKAKGYKPLAETAKATAQNKSRSATKTEKK